MKNQPTFLPFLTATLFSATVILGITACNSKHNPEDKDIAEVQNEARFEDTTKANDADFLVETAWTNFHEIALGQIGRDQSKRPEILVLSKMLIEDHTKAADELKNMADKKNISLPMSAEKNEDEGINKLVKEKSANFDRSFIDVVIQYHEVAIKKFEAAEVSTADTEIKDYIATMLPTLKKHLEEAKKIKTDIQQETPAK